MRRSTTVIANSDHPVGRNRFWPVVAIPTPLYDQSYSAVAVTPARLTNADRTATGAPGARSPAGDGARRAQRDAGAARGAGDREVHAPRLCGRGVAGSADRAGARRRVGDRALVRRPP